MKRRLIHQTGNAGGFTLIEIMITIAILGIILAIATSTWMRQREKSQQRVCQENLLKIDGAKEQWAMECSKHDAATPDWSDLVQSDGSGYLKSRPYCPAAGEYVMNTVSEPVTCSITAPSDHNEKTSF